MSNQTNTLVRDTYQVIATDKISLAILITTIEYVCTFGNFAHTGRKLHSCIRIRLKSKFNDDIAAEENTDPSYFGITVARLPISYRGSLKILEP